MCCRKCLVVLRQVVEILFTPSVRVCVHWLASLNYSKASGMLRKFRYLGISTTDESCGGGGGFKIYFPHRSNSPSVKKHKVQKDIEYNKPLVTKLWLERRGTHSASIWATAHLY